jgi:hypothetical protein
LHTYFSSLQFAARFAFALSWIAEAAEYPNHRGGGKENSASSCAVREQEACEIFFPFANFLGVSREMYVRVDMRAQTALLITGHNRNRFSLFSA